VFPDRQGCKTITESLEMCRRLLLLAAVCQESGLILLLIEIYLASALETYQSCAPTGEPKKNIALQEDIWATITNAMLAAACSAWICYNKASLQVYNAISVCHWSHVPAV
jgi:hypothetical protein